MAFAGFEKIREKMFGEYDHSGKQKEMFLEQNSDRFGGWERMKDRNAYMNGEIGPKAEAPKNSF